MFQTTTTTKTIISSDCFYLDFSRVEFAYYSKERGLDVYFQGRASPINFKDGAEDIWQKIRGLSQKT